jgi:hypothetical protein
MSDTCWIFSENITPSIGGDDDDVDEKDVTESESQIVLFEYISNEF